MLRCSEQARRDTSTRCSYFLDRGADIALEHEEASTALFPACACGHVDVVRLLLDRGAAVDHQGPGGATALFLACFKGHVGVMRLLLDRGADVNRAEVSRGTPLYATCEFGHVDAARLCLERGAEINTTAFGGRAPHDLARNKGFTSMAAWLERISRITWKRHLSEPRYQLVVLRALAARGDARRERAFYGKERVLDILFPGGRPNTRAKRANGDKLRLPDELFSLIARYYWGGGMSAEEEAAERTMAERHAAVRRQGFR